MYVAIDGSFIIETPLLEVKKEGDYLHRDIFDCDSLIAPSIAMLNSKGYPTKYSCQGHITTHSVWNPYDDKKNKAAVVECVNIYTPYIMFNHRRCSIKNFLPFGIPECWYIEFFTKKNGVAEVRDIKKEKIVNGCDYCIRLDETPYFEKVEKLGSGYTPFDFYEDMIKEHRKFYEWVKSIPQRPRRYKVKRTIVLKDED